MKKSRLEQMRANPAGDWTIADVEAVCREHGLRCEPARGGGSHYNLFHRSQRNILTVPSRRPIKAFYIRRLVQYIDAVKKSDAQT
jgi:hypothetical protein